ncbi:MAG: flagellar biosynthesis, hook protein [uncultured bacterium]|nr:MAG: flagellar biosynthesis, hook protein [uncultured bacterium]
MGISSALYSGVSGLNTNSQAMSVIGNNLANTNTVGFKGSRTVFADLLSSNINGSGGVSQVGRGVGMSKVDQIFSQGTFESTESNLDVAIEGEGFFILKQEGNDTAYYSRAGAFRFNDEGYLINPEGYRVQGKQFNTDGELVAGDASDIQVAGTGLIQGNATSTLTLTTNLDSSEPILGMAGFDITDADTYNYSSSVQVFDTLGNPQLLTTYFIKTADNTWNWAWSAETDDGTNTVLQGVGAVPLEFTSDGILLGAAADPPTETTDVIAAADIDWNNGTTPTEIIVTFDTTQFNSANVVLSQDQNGYGAGNLTGVEIDPEGIVIASYSNGQQTKIAQLVLGKFVNPNGLALAGSNLYTESTSSGPPRVGLPGPELGKVFTNSLEQSNVDMGAEFVRMITVQRGFQANSKIITTVDELLGELINLKR